MLSLGMSSLDMYIALIHNLILRLHGLFVGEVCTMFPLYILSISENFKKIFGFSLSFSFLLQWFCGYIFRKLSWTTLVHQGIPRVLKGMLYVLRAIVIPTKVSTVSQAYFFYFLLLEGYQNLVVGVFVESLKVLNTIP